jgi:hypothetical protein
MSTLNALVIALLVACGGSRPAPPVSNSTPVPATPSPVEPSSRCGCTSEVCRGDNEMKYVLAKMCTYAGHMCACKDKACGDGINDDYTRWMTEMAKTASSMPPKINEDEEKAIADHAVKYQECYSKLLTAP